MHLTAAVKCCLSAALAEDLAQTIAGHMTRSQLIPEKLCYIIIIIIIIIDIS